MTKGYNIRFDKTQFLNALGILGFIHLYAIDKMENKNRSTYIQENKNIRVEIHYNSLQIRILSPTQYFTEISYRI